MTTPGDRDEDALLHSAALQNAATILQARRRAEQELVVAKDELRASHARVNSILESIADGFVVLDRDWRFTYVNARAVEIFRPVRGSREELIGQSHWDVFPELRGTDAERVYRRAVAESVSTEIEVFYPSLACWFEVRAYPSKDGLTLFFHDATRRRDAELALIEREAELRALVDSIPQLAWRAGADGKVSWVNQQWQRYTGTTVEQLGEGAWQSLVHPDVLPEVVARWRRSIATGDVFEMEYPIRGVDGVFRTFLTRVNPVRDSADHVVRWFGTATDVEQVKRARDDLREEMRILEILNKTATALASDLDLDSLVQSITVAATDLTGAAFGAFFYNVVDDKGESFTLYALSGAPREAFSKFAMPRNTGVFGPTFRGEAIVRSADITQDPRYGHNAPYSGIPQGHLAVRSYLAVPVITRAGDVLGGLFFGHPDAGVFNDRSERVAGAIALQAAIAIDKAKVYRAAQDEIERRKQVELALRQSEATLDAKVAERTAQLAATNAQLVAEAENREKAEGRFRLLVEGVVDYALYMLDPDGVITNWNTGAERIKGYSASEIVGQHYSRFFTDEDRAAGIPAMGLAKAAAAGKYEAEGWRVRKDGTRFWASIVLDAIRDAEGRLLGFAKITRDVTERRDAQIALQRSQEQLAQAQKMEAIGQLTGGIAHDFNNLLQVIIGNLEALGRRNAGGDDSSQRMLQAAVRGAQSAATLTNRLLAFSRRQPLNPKPIDVNALVSSMSEMLHRALGETITIETVLAAGIWRVAADANQLENSLLNLAVNARDAMPAGGRLTIATANTVLDDAYAEANAMVAGPYVVIAVGDTGTGMDADVLSMAFEPFFTTKDVGKGSGLGLSQVYGFITQSGGHVRMFSELGEGTTIKLYLPQLVSKDDVSQLPILHDLPVGSPERLILVVEDDTDVREHVVSMLHELHYSVLEAADGASALRMLEANPAVQLLFTDVGLPGGMSGRDLADAARIVRPTLLVLFTTGYARHTIVNQGRREAGVDLLPKPFTYAALANRIHELFSEAIRDGTLRPA